MKIRILILTLLIFAGCKKDLLTVTFNMDYKMSFVLPPNVPVNTPFDIITPPVSTNISSTVSQHNTSVDKITRVEMQSYVLEIIAPENQTFSFLRSVDLFIEGPDLPEVQIASRSNIPDNIGNILELDVSGTELQQYLKKDNFTLRISLLTDELTGHVTIENRTRFKVTAAPFK